MNQQKTLLAGAILGGLGVALGAFGAHALKDMLTSIGRLDTFELAVRYEFYHSFALLFVGVLQQFLDSKYLKTAALFFLSGTILFSGSLFLLCFTNNTLFAMATPFGGVLLILGWIFLVVSIIHKK
jgi:uncharacterized membrane protein YgdD (TMEM256/DUF423 family)